VSLKISPKSLSNYLDEFTHRWIGWTFPPALQAIELSGWQPDEFNQYCRQCGDSVGPGEATATGCGTCREGAELENGIGDGVVRLGPYVNELRDWVLKIKYECWSEMGQALGRVLGHRVRQSNLIDRDRLIVVPMPMPWQRRLYRGIDHARVIAAGAARELGAPMASPLARTHHIPQVARVASERKRSGGKGLRIRFQLGGAQLRGGHLLIVDDVRTTGATLKAAVRLLRTLKPERIVCGVLGVSDASARSIRTRRNNAASRVH
jgi:ComF family protein